MGPIGGNPNARFPPISLPNQLLATDDARTEALSTGFKKARKSARRRKAYGTFMAQVSHHEIE